MLFRDKNSKGNDLTISTGHRHADRTNIAIWNEVTGENCHYVFRTTDVDYAIKRAIAKFEAETNGLAGEEQHFAQADKERSAYYARNMDCY